MIGVCFSVVGLSGDVSVLYGIACSLSILCTCTSYYSCLYTFSTFDMSCVCSIV